MRKHNIIRRDQYGSRRQNLQIFTDSFNLEHLIKKPTCFKRSPSCIGLIITNRKAYLKNICTLEIVESRILDFKLKAVVLKSQILKAPPKRKLYLGIIYL